MPTVKFILWKGGIAAMKPSNDSSSLYSYVSSFDTELSVTPISRKAE